MKKFLIVSTLTLTSILAGCTTGVDGETVMGKVGSPAWFDSASPATKFKYFSGVCRAYGFIENTPQMAQCIQNETNALKSRQGVICTKAGSAMICQ